MSKHTSIAAASALVFAIGSVLAPVQQAAAADQKGISATACQPFLPTTYNEARFQDNAIYNSSAVNQRVICPVNKDYFGTWVAGEVTLQAYIKAGASPGKVSCTLYGGGPSWGGAQAAYTATSAVVNAGATTAISIADIADPAVPYGIEGWNVLCTLNAGMSLGGFFFVEDQDTDGAT